MDIELEDDFRYNEYMKIRDLNQRVKQKDYIFIIFDLNLWF